MMRFTDALRLAGFTAGLSLCLLAFPLQAAAEDATAPIPVARGVLDVEGGLVQIASPKDGVVRQVFVEEGETVAENQPLVEIDPRSAELQIAINQAQLAEKRAAVATQTIRVATAHRERSRLDPLARSNAVSQKSADTAESDYQVALAELAARQAELATVEAQLRSAQLELELRTVRAPAQGTIVRRLVRPGDGASTLNVTPLFWFAPTGNRIIRAELDEAFAHRIREGQPVEIRLESDQRRSMTQGVVRRVGAAFGPRRATTYEPRDRADARVLEVVIEMPAGAMKGPLGQRVLVRFGGERS